MERKRYYNTYPNFLFFHFNTKSIPNKKNSSTIEEFINKIIFTRQGL